MLGQIEFLILLGSLGFFIGNTLLGIANHLMTLKCNEIRSIDVSQFKNPMRIAGVILFVWIGASYNNTNLEWLAAIWLAIILLTVSYTDMVSMRILNSVVLIGILGAAFLRMVIHPLPFWNYVCAAVIGFSILFLLSIATNGGIGGGDMKLYLFIGLLSGITVTLLSLFLASLFGSFYGIIQRYRGKLMPKQPIPFGPFIATATIISFLYGEVWLEHISQQFYVLLM